MNYFASEQISDNIGRTPENFLVVTDCVLARTGNQEYSVKDLPQEGADALGVDLSDPNAPVDLFRPPEEVFATDAMATLEGKPLTNNHPSNGDFVGPNNIQDLAYGHVQNIRKGTKPLESGDWPLVGDIIITREPLLSDIENGARPELSVGYEYTLAKDDSGNLLQTAIRANHVAVVPKGRAGAEARINDAAPDPATNKKPEIPTGPQATGSGSAGRITKDKEYKPMSLKRIFGLGLKAAAQDAETKPEDLAEMATEFAASDKKADDKKARDEAAEEEEEEKKAAEDRAAEDRRRAEDRRTSDRRTDDRRQAMHDALDRMLASEDSRTDDRRAEDVDLDELKALTDQFFEEEKGEQEHAQDLEVPPIEEGEPVEEGGDAEPLPPEEEAEVLASDRRARTGDRFLGGRSQVRTADAKQILDTLRRGIARTGDRDLIRTFNGLAARFTRSSKPSSGAYGTVARAAQTVRTGDVGADRYPNRNQPLNRSISAEDREKLQEAYNSRRSNNTTEVKK